MHGDSVRLKVKIVIESEDGRIIEIDEDEVVQAVFDHRRFDHGAEILMAYFDTKVRSPVRGMIRAYFSKRREESGYHRRHTGMEQPPSHWPQKDEIMAKLDAKLSKVVIEREKEDHGVSRLSP